jgi:hypothetical protein
MKIKNMTKEKKSTINVQGTEISILTQKENDYISLTDMVKTLIEEVL